MACVGLTQCCITRYYKGCDLHVERADRMAGQAGILIAVKRVEGNERPP